MEIHQHNHHDNTSSSDDEDGDDQWKAQITAAASAYTTSKPNPTPTLAPTSDDDNHRSKTLQPQLPKHYQIKAQKALDDILEKSLVVVKDSRPSSKVESDNTTVASNVGGDDTVANGGGVRLFKRAPVGIVFDYRVELKGPTKKPRIIPGEELDEKSKKFKKSLRSVAVEGTDILAAAKDAAQKSKARLEAKELAAKEAAKREEERVAQLKKIRGERWLPSMAKYMQVKP